MTDQGNKKAKYYDHPVNECIRVLVNAKNISELAEYLKISPDAVNQWRAGYTRPSIDKLGEIAKFFGVTTDYLLGVTPDNIPNLDVRAVVEKTRLTKSAIERLLWWAKDERYDPKITTTRTGEEDDEDFMETMETETHLAPGIKMLRVASMLIEHDLFWNSIDSLLGARVFDLMTSRFGNLEITELPGKKSLRAGDIADFHCQKAIREMTKLVEEVRCAKD